MGRTLVVDNYDSFTFNLVHIVEQILDNHVDVRRNDEILPGQIAGYQSVIFSPGPGLPSESKGLMALVRAALEAECKVLGVCLGHQALAVATGGGLKNLKEVHHGVSLPMQILQEDQILFKGLGPGLLAGRYHSWVVDEASLSEDWIVTSRDGEGEVMAMRHTRLPVFGIQFHPESVLTPDGPEILRNFLLQ
jgi:anthranilate synthase component 2